MMKECFRCRETKPLFMFYKHKHMGDGHLNKCIECTRKDVAEYRERNIEKIRAYDRKRGNRQTHSYAASYKEKYPNKYRAHTMVGNAIRDKKLFKESCEICGEKSAHAHHDDYSKPLNVRWLCQAHHSQWHAKNGKGANG